MNNASPAGAGGLSSVPGWLAGLLATGGEPAACRRFFRECPGVSTETVRLCAAGVFTRRALGRGRPDYVFYRQPGAGEPHGLIELKRAEGAVQGYYSTRWPAGEDRAALACGRFLNSEDFFLAGAGPQAILFVGTAPEATRACHGLLARLADRGELGAGLLLYTGDDLQALLAGATGPALFVVEALPSRPAPGAAHGDGAQAEAALAFQRAYEFLRALLGAYAKEFSPAPGDSPQALKPLAVRLHEVACKAADSQGALVVAAALAPARGPWARALRAYEDIAERLGQLPALLVPAAPGQGGRADDVAAELADLLSRAQRILDKLHR